MVILITGKQGAGKTTYANKLLDDYIKDGKKCSLIDGDEYRKITSNNDFSNEGRIKNLMGAAKIAAEIEKQSDIVILAFIAPLKKWRNEMREYWKMSRVVYIPGGNLWKNTIYEMPDESELSLRYNKNIK